MSEPTDMEVIVDAEELLEAASKEDWPGGVIFIGFRDNEGFPYISTIKNRYLAAGHLMDIVQFLLSGEGEDE